MQTPLRWSLFPVVTLFLLNLSVFLVTQVISPAGLAQVSPAKGCQPFVANQSGRDWGAVLSSRMVSRHQSQAVYLGNALDSPSGDRHFMLS
jgi:hypothetical protein